MFTNFEYSARLDWLWASYFLNYFEAELFNQYGPVIKNVHFAKTRKKIVYSKLVNNRFKAQFFGMEILHSSVWDFYLLYIFSLSIWYHVKFCLFAEPFIIFLVFNPFSFPLTYSSFNRETFQGADTTHICVKYWLV